MISNHAYTFFFKISLCLSWSMPAVIVLRSLRKENQKFLASLDYIERPFLKIKSIYLNISRNLFSQILYYPCA